MIGWNGGGASTASWILMGVSMLVFWGGLIALIVWLVHSMGRHSMSSLPPPPKDANEVLARRFARGEITEDEFLHRRAVLRTGAGGSARSETAATQRVPAAPSERSVEWES